MKKVLAFALAVIMIICLLYIPTQASDTSGKWTDEGKFELPTPDAGGQYHITTAKQLAGVSVLTATKPDETVGKTFMLESDIDLSAHYWVPIGTVDNQFKGTFDGGGHTVSGMKINEYYQRAGFIGYSGSGDIINLNISNANINITYNGKDIIQAGGIAGYINDNVINCSVNNCTLAAGGLEGVALGAVVGSQGTLRNCKATNCTVLSTASKAAAFAGGIAGLVSNNITGCTAFGCGIIANAPEDAYSGGIGGNISSAYGCTVSNCNISASGSANVYSGGSVGAATGLLVDCAVISGAVSIISTAAEAGDCNIFAGSLAGCASGSSDCYTDTALSFTDAYLTVKAASFVGEVNGDIHGYINSEKEGTLPVYVKNPNNAYTVSVGKKTAEQMKSQAFNDELNAYWTNNVSQSDDGNAIWGVETESGLAHTGYPLPHPPYVADMTITPPTYCGGNAVIHIVGTDLEYANKIIVSNKSNHYTVDKTTLSAEIPSSIKWSILGGSTVYTDEYTYLVSLNDANVGYLFTKTGSFTLSPDDTNKLAAVKTLSYISEVEGNGSAVEVYLSGDYLDTTVKAIELYAEIRDSGSIVYKIPAVINRTGGTVVATLALPKNITASAQTYTLVTYLQGVAVEFDTQYMLTVEPDTGSEVGTVSCDINNDGELNVLDVICLTRIINQMR